MQKLQQVNLCDLPGKMAAMYKELHYKSTCRKITQKTTSAPLPHQVRGPQTASTNQVWLHLHLNFKKKKKKKKLLKITLHDL